jgi:hypothetical protein
MYSILQELYSAKVIPLQQVVSSQLGSFSPLLAPELDNGVDADEGVSEALSC